MLSMLVIIKLVAFYLGPQGLAQLGFFMSLASIVAVFAGGGINNAVIKSVAANHGSPVRIIRFMGAAVLYGSTFSAIVLALSILFARPMTQFAFADETLWWVMPIFGVAQIFAFIGVVTVASANGADRQDLFAKITATAYLGAMIGAYFLVSRLGIIGGALALVLVTASVGIVSLVVIFRSGVLRVLRLRYQRDIFIQLFQFSLIMISAATFFPISEILIRSKVIADLGIETGGFWQGTIRLSGAYIGFFAVFLATTFMPRLSRTPNLYDCRRIVLSQLLRTGGVFVVFALAVFLLRNKLIILVYSEEFLPIADVLLWQLIGDTLRICSYLIGFLLVAKAAVRLAICVEFIQFSLYLAITFLMITIDRSLEGIAQAYALSYGIYFLGMLALLFWYTRTPAP
jgi:PST family polysaccharide transporter/antigen flippase